MKLLFFLFFSSIHLLGVSQEFKNLDFEEIDLDGKAKHWRTGSKTHQIDLDSLTRQNGKYSMKISSVSTEGFGAFSQLVKLTMPELKKFRLSGYIKFSDVGTFTGLWINVRNKSETVFFDNMASKRLKGSKNWALYSIDFVVDETATSINLGGLVAGGGSAWFDQLSIKPIIENEKNSAVQTYLTSFVDIVKEHSIRKDSIDLDRYIRSTFKLSEGAKKTSDCYPAMRYLLSKLNDNHSHLVIPQNAKAWKGDKGSENNDQFESASGKMIDEKIAYIEVPGFRSGNQKLLEAFATDLQELIKKLDLKDIKGWIVDLRENIGGNSWPMLAGIGPLLDDGVSGYFVKPDGTNTSWFYKKGKAGIDNEPIVQIKSGYRLKNKNPKIAVLTGPRTMSSGEVIAVSFIGNSNTMSFGEPTRGLTTGNEQFELSDGALLFLATSTYANRNMKLYSGKVSPDKEVKFSKETFDSANDPVIAAATSWLKEEN